MGNHRADRRGRDQRPSVTPSEVEAAPRRRVDDAPGKRRAAHTASRGQLFRGLPSVPVLLGIAALAVSAGGAVTAADPALISSDSRDQRVAHASALTGTGKSSSTSLLDDRRAAVSRDSRRDALADAASEELVEAAERQAEERNAALALFAKQAEQQAAKIALNQWVLPVDNVSITAEFGDYGLWASYHTGLDFNGNTGDPIKSVANGIVTSVGYDGSYGNKTVITLDDGTEIWYCHQNAYGVTSATSSGPARSSARSAPPATSPARTSTSRSAPVVATRSTRTPRSWSTASRPELSSKLHPVASLRSTASRPARSGAAAA